MNERLIVYQAGSYHVLADKPNKAYTVYKDGLTHATADSSYAMTEDGRTIAIARCKYLAKHA